LHHLHLDLGLGLLHLKLEAHLLLLHLHFLLLHGHGELHFLLFSLNIRLSLHHGRVRRLLLLHLGHFFSRKDILLRRLVEGQSDISQPVDTLEFGHLYGNLTELHQVAALLRVVGSAHGGDIDRELERNRWPAFVFLHDVIQNASASGDGVSHFLTALLDADIVRLTDHVGFGSRVYAGLTAATLIGRNARYFLGFAHDHADLAEDISLKRSVCNDVHGLTGGDDRSVVAHRELFLIVLGHIRGNPIFAVKTPRMVQLLGALLAGLKLEGLKMFRLAHAVELVRNVVKRDVDKGKLALKVVGPREFIKYGAFVVQNIDHIVFPDPKLVKGAVFK